MSTVGLNKKLLAEVEEYRAKVGDENISQATRRLIRKGLEVAKKEEKKNGS